LKIIQRKVVNGETVAVMELDTVKQGLKVQDVDISISTKAANGF
jgi:hypothetical protein